MSWIKITMKFDGKCLVCNQKVKSKEIGLWSEWFKPENFKEALDNPNISQEAKDYFNAIDWEEIKENIRKEEELNNS